MDIPENMKVTYIERRRKDYIDCLAAIESKNADVLKRVGHQMKGNALSFGFDDLAGIGENLENAAEKKDWEQIKVCVTQFGSYLQKQ